MLCHPERGRNKRSGGRLTHNREGVLPNEPQSDHESICATVEERPFKGREMDLESERALAPVAAVSAPAMSQPRKNAAHAQPPDHHSMKTTP